MGNLTPGATYIYERTGGITYAREFGSTEKVPIGWDYNSHDNHFNAKFWGDILKEAETNPALQKAVDRVIMMYKLGKEKL